MAQPDARAEESADVARGVDESLEGLLPLLWRTEDADRDAGVAQIWTHFHFGHRGEADARILDFLSDDRAYLVLQLLGQPLRTVIHKPLRIADCGLRIADCGFLNLNRQSEFRNAENVIGLFLQSAIRNPQFLLQFSRRDLLCDEGFDDVADLVIVETFDGDTAFVSLLHFADVFFESAQAADVAFEEDHVVADQAGMRRAFDRPVRYHAAGDGADLRHADDVADFGLADDGLFGRGLHQPEHRVADLFFHFIDDRMQPDVDVLLFGRVVGAGFGSHVEPDDHRRRAGLGGVGRAGEQHVVVGDRADARADDADFDLLGREFGQRVLEHLDGALHVGLEDDQQLFDLAGFHLHGELVEPPGGGAGQGHHAGLRLAELADLLRLGDVVDDLELVAGGGHAFKT